MWDIHIFSCVTQYLRIQTRISAYKLNLLISSYIIQKFIGCFLSFLPSSIHPSFFPSFFLLFPFFFFHFFLRQGFHIYFSGFPWLPLNSLYRPGWPQTQRSVWVWLQNAGVKVYTPTAWPHWSLSMVINVTYPLLSFI